MSRQFAALAQLRLAQAALADAEKELNEAQKECMHPKLGTREIAGGMRTYVWCEECMKQLHNMEWSEPAPLPPMKELLKRYSKVKP